MSAITASMVKDLRERTGLGMMECKKALVDAAGDAELAIENLRKSSGMKAAKKAGRVAADGVVAVRADQGKAVLLEVNSETDFVARDDNFLAFVSGVADQALATGASSVEELLNGELEASREALIQKIGENITVRRVTAISSEGVLGSYVHGNNRIGVLVELNGGDEALAKDVAMHVAAVNPQVAKPEEMPQEAVAKEKEIFTAQAAESGKPAEIIEKMVEGRLRKYLAENSLVEQPFVKDPDQTVGKLLKAAGADIVGFTRYEVGEGIEKKEDDFAAEVAAQVAGASS
ncbi:MAG: elongation factor Ts [Porticoccaceae bacterium]|jgi:elongation factor Ts|nr:elongation factor Ts [Porticoccaceae bacterium]